MARRYSNQKKKKTKERRSSYNLRSSCDGQSCDENSVHTAKLCGSCSDKVRNISHHQTESSRSSHSPSLARSRPKTKRQPKKAAPASRRVSKHRPSSRGRTRTSHDRRSRSRTSSSSSGSYITASSSQSYRRSSTSRPRRKKSAQRSRQDKPTSASFSLSDHSVSSKRSRRPTPGPRVSFNLSANTTRLFSTSSPVVTASPSYSSSSRSKSRSPPRTSTPKSHTRERSRSPVTAFSPRKGERKEVSPIRSRSPPPLDRDDHMALLLTPDKEDNVQMGHAEKLVVEGDLDVKTVMLFYKKDDRLVVDSQVIIVPKGITEQEMEWQVQRLRADKKVYVHEFADGEDEMELMEVSVMTSDKAIFIRRVSGMSLAGKTSIFCCHPTEKISPVRFGDEAGVLNLEDIYSVTRSETAISRREKFIISFGRDKPNSRQLQQELKAAPAVVPPDSRLLYVEESVTLVGKLLVVEKGMHLEKACWLQEATWKQKLVKDYQVKPTFVVHVMETPILRPSVPTAPPRPAAGRRLLGMMLNNKKNEVAQMMAHEKEGERMSRLETNPKEFLAIEGRLDVPSLHEVMIKNVSVTPAAWAMKTTRGGHFHAAPAYGIIRPGATTKISLRFAGFGGGEEPSPTDRVDVVWRDVEADAVFARQLFLADNIVIQKKVLPIRYLPN